MQFPILEEADFCKLDGILYQNQSLFEKNSVCCKYYRVPKKWSISHLLVYPFNIRDWLNWNIIYSSNIFYEHTEFRKQSFYTFIYKQKSPCWQLGSFSSLWHHYVIEPIVVIQIYIIQGIFRKKRNSLFQ